MKLTGASSEHLLHTDRVVAQWISIMTLDLTKQTAWQISMGVTAAGWYYTAAAGSKAAHEWEDANFAAGAGVVCADKNKMVGPVASIRYLSRKQ